MKLYGKLKKLKRGVTLQISITFRCMNKCKYCCQTFVSTERNKKETNFIGWVRFFERFPYKLREVYVSGGEPTIHPDFVRLVKYLLGKGYMVKVFTNLQNIQPLLELPKCPRLIIKATYHHHFPESLYRENYEKVTKLHRVDVDELEYQVLEFSGCRPLLTKDVNENYDINMLRISPDLTINLNCYELIKHK